jgi:glyoxylase-like metal-dependent hydrolase (beta-lactamase superfamily II)
MPPAADELQQLPSNLTIWHAYDRTAKVELFSTAVMTSDGLVVIDPVDLNIRARSELEALGPVASIVISNANHRRASDFFGKRYAAPIFAPAELADQDLALGKLAEGEISGLQIIAIDGAAPGEFAIYDQRDGGALIVGDSLINFEPYSFNFLPPKYCTNHKQMIRSLKRLLDFQFERLLFAHGEPIISRARKRLALLLHEVS